LRKRGDINKPKTDYDGYHELANAIVLQAIEDFRYAVADEKICEDKLQRGEIPDNVAIPKIRYARSEQIRLRKFFKSAWCEWLTEMDCSHLADKIKKDTLEYLRLAEIAMSTPEVKAMTKIRWDEDSENLTKLFQDQFQCPTCGGKVNMNYGFCGSVGKKDKRMNKYGWRIQCEGCRFVIKVERERIKPIKKGEENEEDNS
jgi:hypothetical protein